MTRVGKIELESCVQGQSKLSLPLGPRNPSSRWLARLQQAVGILSSKSISHEDAEAFFSRPADAASQSADH